MLGPSVTICMSRHTCSMARRIAMSFGLFVAVAQETQTRWSFRQQETGNRLVDKQKGIL